MDRAVFTYPFGPWNHGEYTNCCLNRYENIVEVQEKPIKFSGFIRITLPIIVSVALWALIVSAYQAWY